MGREIFYERRFLEVDGLYVPIIQCGTSNSWEYNDYGRQVPEKFWTVLHTPYKDKFLFTKEEIGEMYNKEEYKGNFYKSRNSCHENFSEWLISGTKHAKSIEKTVAIGNRLHFNTREIRGGDLTIFDFATKEEFYYLLNEHAHLRIDITYAARDYTVERAPVENFDISKGYYVLKEEHEPYYFQKMSKTSLFVTGSVQLAKKFKKPKDALSYVEKYKDKFTKYFYPYWVAVEED